MPSASVHSLHFAKLSPTSALLDNTLPAKVGVSPCVYGVSRSGFQRALLPVFVTLGAKVERLNEMYVTRGAIWAPPYRKT